jgi:hypothetical protein
VVVAIGGRLAHPRRLRSVSMGIEHGGGDLKGMVSRGLVVCQYCADRCGDRRAGRGWAAARMGRGWPMSGMARGEARAGGFGWRRLV